MPAMGSLPGNLSGPPMAFRLVAGIAALAAPVSAQEAARLVTSPDLRVSADPEVPYVEQSLAVSPVDPDHLAGASMTVDTSDMVVVVVSSRDGGRNWTEVPVEACGWDPWIAFLPSGNVLLACARNYSDAVLVLRSEDGGATWRGPTEILPEGRAYDHPTIVADQTDGPHGGYAYVVAGEIVRSRSGRAELTAPAVVTSRDGGLTFSPPVRLQATNAWSMVGAPVVTADGALGFTMVDYAVDYREAGGLRLLETERVWWARSDDGGRTLSIPHLVEEKKLMGWSPPAVDTSSGPYAGRSYVTFHDLRDGRGGIYVARSSDGGETWSDAVLASRPFENDEGFTFRLPNVAVNGRGEVLVTWLANAEDPGTSCGRLVASVSVDGGATFLRPVPVADVDACSTGPGNVVDQRRRGRFDAGERWPGGGDYYGLTALSDDSFRVVWADSRTGVFQIWTDRIVVERAGTAEGPTHDDDRGEG